MCTQNCLAVIAGLVLSISVHYHSGQFARPAALFFSFIWLFTRREIKTHKKFPLRMGKNAALMLYDRFDMEVYIMCRKTEYINWLCTWRAYSYFPWSFKGSSWPNIWAAMHTHPHRKCRQLWGSPRAIATDFFSRSFEPLILTFDHDLCSNRIPIKDSLFGWWFVKRLVIAGRGSNTIQGGRQHIECGS